PLVANVLVRKRVAELERQERLVARADAALNEELEQPRLGRVERKVVRSDEQRDLAQVRRPIGRQCAEPGMIAVAEAGAGTVLDQLDAVENAAADISRALERIGAVAGDNDRLLSR